MADARAIAGACWIGAAGRPGPVLVGAHGAAEAIADG
jgi:hypothetical protein